MGVENIVEIYKSRLLKKGHKGKGERLLYKMLRDLKKKNKGVRPINYMEKSLYNLGPRVGLVSKKVGGAVYQIPVPLKEGRELQVGASWLIGYVNNIKGVSIYNKLIKEIELAAREEGELIKKRKALHKVAKSNRAFLKFLG